MAVPVTRRHILRLLSLSGIATATYPLTAQGDEIMPTDPASPHKVPDHLSFIVGGPENSNLGQWSTYLSQILSRNLQLSSILPVQYTTGYDGVTAANRFDNRISPDGNTALLTSGNALISGISGDSRVHFDYERWIPILTSLSPSVAVARQPFHTSIPEALRNRSLRVAISNSINKELPTLLGIELLKINAIPVMGFTDYHSSLTALRNNTIDIVPLNEPQAINDLPSLLQEGFHVFFSLDGSTNYGPSFIDLYNNLFHYKNVSDLFEAWKSIALASRMNIAMLLPMLTPSPLVTKWRLNIDKAIQDPQIKQLAKTDNISLQASPDCINTYNKMCPSSFATLALRRWLSAKESSWNLSL